MQLTSVHVQSHSGASEASDASLVAERDAEIIRQREEIRRLEQKVALLMSGCETLLPRTNSINIPLETN